MKKLKKINIAIIVVSLIINTIFIVLTLMDKYNSNLLVCLSLYIILFIPAIANKLFKTKISDMFVLIFLTFIFVAQLLGSVAHFYALVSWYDSFVHFVSGIVSAFFSLKLLDLFNNYNCKNKAFNILFCIAFTIMVATLWEIFEFSSDRIFGHDAQKVLETGVTDTMKDIICATTGSISFLMGYFYGVFSGKNKLNKIICNKKRVNP